MWDAASNCQVKKRCEEHTQNMKLIWLASSWLTWAVIRMLPSFRPVPGTSLC